MLNRNFLLIQKLSWGLFYPKRNTRVNKSTENFKIHKIANIAYNSLIKVYRKMS